MGLLGLGALLLVASLVIGANPGASPALQATSKGLRAPVPYVILMGFGLLVLYSVLRPTSGTRPDRRNEAPMFGKDTTTFAAYMGDEAEKKPDRRTPW